MLKLRGYVNDPVIWVCAVTKGHSLVAWFTFTIAFVAAGLGPGSHATVHIRIKYYRRAYKALQNTEHVQSVLIM